jgi:hypothetical protein
MQLEWMSRLRSSAISAMCANEIGNLKYHRTHQRMISRVVTPFEGFDADGHASRYQILIRSSQRYQRIPSFFARRETSMASTVRGKLSGRSAREYR